MAHILVIDDEKSIRSTLREILEYEKFKVTDAADGMECHSGDLRGRRPPVRRHLRDWRQGPPRRPGRRDLRRVHITLALSRRKEQQCRSVSAVPPGFSSFNYHPARTHLALDQDAPECRTVQSPRQGSAIGIPEVGGLHHRHERRAA